MKEGARRREPENEGGSEKEGGTANNSSTAVPPSFLPSVAAAESKSFVTAQTPEKSTDEEDEILANALRKLQGDQPARSGTIFC